MFSEAIKKLQGLLWSRHISDYLDERGDVYYMDEDDFGVLKQHVRTHQVKIMPTDNMNVEDVFSYIFNNIPEDVKKVEKVVKLSGVGQIIQAEKAGCFTFLQIHKSDQSFEQNVQNNLPYLNTIGFKTNSGPKLRPKDIEIPVKERIIVDNNTNEIKVKNKELLNEVKQLKKLNAVQLKQMTKLEKQNLALGRKYDSLSKSKLGKVTFKYWDLRKRLNF